MPTTLEHDINITEAIESSGELVYHHSNIFAVSSAQDLFDVLGVWAFGGDTDVAVSTQTEETDTDTDIAKGSNPIGDTEAVVKIVGNGYFSPYIPENVPDDEDYKQNLNPKLFFEHIGEIATKDIWVVETKCVPYETTQVRYHTYNHSDETYEYNAELPITENIKTK